MTGVYFKIFHESIDSELNQLTKEYETEISTPLLNFANSFEKKRKAQPFPNISEDCNAIDLSFIIEKLYKASCLQDIIKAKSKKEAAETHLENAQIRDVKDNNVEYEKFRILADVNYRPNATYSAINKYLQTSLNAPVTK
uniref:Uncharacterized protein n=1 Tax=Panagrolaimus davidi TaxID=227884 RepID=A0A914QR59_9BILA